MRDDAEIADVILTHGAVVFWGLFCKSAPEQGAGHNKKVNQVAQYSVLPGFTCANSVQKCRRRRCLPPIPARVRPAVPESACRSASAIRRACRRRHGPASAAGPPDARPRRTEERRVGKECGSTGRTWWTPT